MLLMDGIILHEFGHRFVDHFSDDRLAGRLPPRSPRPQLAYGEGLAYFWATMLADERAYVDNFLGEYRTIDLESVTYNGEEVAEMFGTADGTVNGLRREEISAAIMYDVYDDSVDTEPFDRIAIGPDGMMEIFLGWFGGDAPPLDLGRELIDGLARRARVHVSVDARADIQDIVEARAARTWTPRSSARSPGSAPVYATGEASRCCHERNTRSVSGSLAAVNSRRQPAGRVRA